jgi:putative acetyltransferase
MIIRAEKEEDKEAVYSVNVSAFDTSVEASLVNNLRDQAEPIISLVAEENSDIIGHIMFSPLFLPGYPNLKLMALAPMAVTPNHQRKGIGSALVVAGLEQCKKLGSAAVFVLGHPEYYPRFGFQPSSRFNILSEYDVPDEVFMAIELQPGALRGKTGKVKYHAAFCNV